MAQAILLRGGAGGVTSDDVTASKAHVLKGYKTVTTESNDEIVEGEIVNRGNGMDTVEFADAYWDSKYVARMEQGFYAQAGQWKPYVAIPYAVMANILGLNPSKMLKSLSIAGRQGQIEERGSYVNAGGVWYYGDGNYLVAQIPPGYYGGDNGNGKTNVNISKQDLVNNLGLNPDLWLDSFQTMGIRGKIQRWICNTTDILETTQGFAYNDAANGRGQGVVMAIKNGHKIENANWIFLRMPDLLPHNVRQGINLGGVIGTMPDYSTGRTVFNGATFDGILVSGVATKGFYLNGTYFAYNLNQNYGYAGIYNGGMNFNLSTGYPALKSRRIGCVLSQSINLTPFRQIVISYRTLANIQGNPYATLEAHVNRASTRRLIDVAGAGKVDAIDVLRQGIASPAINRTGQIVLNVADINEQAFISFGAYCNSDRASDLFAGAVQITKIDFLN